MRLSSRFRLLAAALAVSCLPCAQAGALGHFVEYGNRSFRLDANGDLSCLSLDGHKPEKDRGCASNNDLWLFDVNGGSRDMSLRGFSCGRQHALAYANNGYDVRGHWCNTVYASLFAKWEAVDARLLSRTPQGEVMCHSTNGKDCSVAGTVDTRRGRSVNPLICGKQHQEVWGIEGYGAPGHWCDALNTSTQSPFGPAVSSRP